MGVILPWRRKHGTCSSSIEAFSHLPSPKAGVFFAGVFRVRSHPGSRPSLEELGQAQQHLRSVGGESRVKCSHQSLSPQRMEQGRGG